MNDYTLETVYLHISDTQRQEVMALWERERAVQNEVERERRSHEVVVMARHANGSLVGVSTVAVRMATDGERYYYYRMFIDSHHRVPYLMQIVARTTHEFLATFHHPEGEVQRLVVVTENRKLTRPGIQRLFERIGYTYQGKTAQGLDCWIYRF